MMSFKVLILALAIAFVQAQKSKLESDSLDKLIDGILSRDNNAAADGIPKPCVSPNGVAGECVPYYLCKERDTSDLIDIRVKDDRPCADYLEQCCETNDVPLTQTTPPTNIRNSPTCGFRNVEGVGFRITGNNDNEAEYGEFPWMVAVLREDKVDDFALNVYQCGGSLISPSVVLTAAHCVNNKAPSTLKVRAGEWDTQTRNENFPHVDRDVMDVVVHEQYYKAAFYNDVALLFLKDPIDSDVHINNVCLPPQDTNFDHKRCFVTGWGKDTFGKEGKYQAILKKIEIPTVPFNKCQESLRKTRLGETFSLHSSFLCAGGEPGKDACKGDGGSPLVCPISHKPGYYYQAGIVAWGIGCGEDGTPGVYADVSKFRQWIDGKIIERNLPTQSYNI